MNLLLDTHTFLWAIDNNSTLSSEARDAIVDGNNIVFVSAATAWEISIKKAIGKLTIPEGSYLDELQLHRFTALNITTEHALAVENLPHSSSRSIRQNFDRAGPTRKTYSCDKGLQNHGIPRASHSSLNCIMALGASAMFLPDLEPMLPSTAWD